MATEDREKGLVNHKEFITWREFVDFFEDYKTPEQLARQRHGAMETWKEMKSEWKKAEEMKLWIDEEKDNRLRGLPRFREGDQIDAAPEHLDLIGHSGVFGRCPLAENTEDEVLKVDFFKAIRNDPDVLKIMSTLARDPAGVSRLPIETFEQVFSRMEWEHHHPNINWSTILEYFTKRGRPLTDEEYDWMIQEDRRLEEEYQEELEDQWRREEERQRSLKINQDRGIQLDTDDIPNDLEDEEEEEEEEYDENYEPGQR